MNETSENKILTMALGVISDLNSERLTTYSVRKTKGDKPVFVRLHADSDRLHALCVSVGDVEIARITEQSKLNLAKERFDERSVDEMRAALSVFVDHGDL